MNATKFKYEAQSSSGLVHLVTRKPSLKVKALTSACKPSINATQVMSNGETCKRCAINVGLPYQAPQKTKKSVSAAPSIGRIGSTTVTLRSKPYHTVKRGKAKYTGKHYDDLITRLGSLGVMATVNLDNMGWVLNINVKGDLRVMVWHPEFSADDQPEWNVHYGNAGTGDMGYLIIPSKAATSELLSGIVYALAVDMKADNRI